MEKIKLPGTDVKITPITFGAWAIGGWFWGGAEKKESIRAIETAINNGMTTIDTAPIYGFGQSEEFVGKAIIVYSPLQRGILTGKITADYKFNEGDHRPNTPFYKEPNLSRINQFLKEIKPIAVEKNSTLAQFVIRWTLLQPGITCVLVGARNEKQVLENIKAAELTITAEEMKIINEKLNNLNLEL